MKKMAWWQSENFEKKKSNLEKRMQIVKAVRNFFDVQGFYEVETPALQMMPCADMHIHGFYTEYFGPDLEKRKDFYLHTSPEFEMKKLLVAGLPKIFQICKVFRNGENTRLHSPEFTMLEWYRSDADYRDIMEDCEELIRDIARVSNIKAFQYKDNICDPLQKFERISVAEAFEKYAGINLSACLRSSPPPKFSSRWGAEALKEQEGGHEHFVNFAKEIGVRTTTDDKWDDIFHAVMAKKIEPYLGQGAPTILYDYPANMACLSKKAKDPRFAERFELYICGVELANAFSELTDATEQRARFEKEMKAKQEHYGFSYLLDEDFLAALEYGMPEAGGIALGLDRLIMLACGAEKIDDILWTGKP